MPRLQIDVTDKQLRDLEALMDRCDISTKKGLFDNALALLDWAVGERARGRIIASIDEQAEHYHELLMPVLNSVEVDARRGKAAFSPFRKQRRADPVEEVAVAAAKPDAQPVEDESAAPLASAND